MHISYNFICYFEYMVCLGSSGFFFFSAPRPFLTGCTPSRVSRPASANASSNHNSPRHIIQSNDLDKGVNGNSGRLATKGGAAAASQMRALSSALSTTLTRLRRLTTAVQHGHPLPGMT